MSNASLFSRLYDPVMELPERAGLRRLRVETLQGVRGRVLELGIGTGRNLPLYPPSVERLSGIDPDEILLRRARERSNKDVPFPVDLRLATAEELPFEDETFDAVTATLVFCTVADPPRALREARRVLRKGGELRLLEHVKMGRKGAAWLQEKATPLWKHAAGGCHLDRETLSAVRESGFEVDRVESHLDGLLLAIFARNGEETHTPTPHAPITHSTARRKDG